MEGFGRWLQYRANSCAASVLHGRVPSSSLRETETWSGWLSEKNRFTFSVILSCLVYFLLHPNGKAWELVWEHVSTRFDQRPAAPEIVGRPSVGCSAELTKGVIKAGDNRYETRFAWNWCFLSGLWVTDATTGISIHELVYMFLLGNGCCGLRGHWTFGFRTWTLENARMGSEHLETIFFALEYVRRTSAV